MTTPEPAYTAKLLRHFADLRDGTHGDATSRRDKEQLFTEAVSLLDSYARQALDEINAHLLLSTGEVTASGLRSLAGWWGSLRLDTLLAGAARDWHQPDRHRRLLRFGIPSSAPARRHRRRFAA